MVASSHRGLFCEEALSGAFAITSAAHDSVYERVLFAKDSARHAVLHRLAKVGSGREGARLSLPISRAI